ncbi:haloacid dehalogenase [Sphaerisporangium melleum]|uniref:Haloacid dehalogenase n=1 Tax=Sphaerisporangium melleum TaxID=321316 RepID=A0A917RLI2_9ACTN|nr:HAD family phosphatase [Sphaerisporangium melleum]GGL12453.1 haloacid dehalogenase [Sphaerisporangium melleum]GII74461.1 haloacid dehalogenase [Sphaerisporangium melleum]
MKWVLFDYGEVLCHAQPEADRERLVEAAGIDPDRFWRGYWEHRLEFDRGTLTPGAYWSEVLDRRARDAEVERLVALDVASWTHVNDAAVAVMQELRDSGRPVALLSNAPACVAEGIERLSWIPAMHARFYSGHMGLVKPDAEIYLRVATALGAPPQDVVFVDDRLVNVHGAEAAGMSAVHFRDAGTLRDDLKLMLSMPSA